MNIEERENENKSGEEYIKVTISKKSEKSVSDLLARVNDGYEGGRVSRQDLLSWVLAKFVECCTDQEIRAIRADHFDEIALLEISLKRFRQAGALPPELKRMLMAQVGIEDSTRKAVKKPVDNKVHQ